MAPTNKLNILPIRVLLHSSFFRNDLMEPGCPACSAMIFAHPYRPEAQQSQYLGTLIAGHYSSYTSHIFGFCNWCV
jgi:hypothetical protein